jgi:hypothetical protein
MTLRFRNIFILSLLLGIPFSLFAQPPTWGNYNGNPQHTGLSTVPLQDLNLIKWSMPVDFNPDYSGNDLLIHYGSPVITANNTVIVPQKTGLTDGFQVQAVRGFDGLSKWTQSTDYILPPHDWTPSYAPAITPQNRLYYAGQGGTVFYRDNLDANGTVTPTRLAFYGNTQYNASTTAARNNIFINTPITPDANGDIFFGFQVTNTVTLGPPGQQVTLNAGGGLARIDANGNATYVQASTAANDASINKLVHNAAPAISNDGSTVYVAVTNKTGTGFGAGYLLALNSTTLATTGSVRLKDVNTPANDAQLPEAGSASPMVAPNGDVYFGVLENTSQYHSRGWMLHFNSNLTQTMIPSRFGWDNTATIVPPSAVPSYTGNSPYLILTKYNNYAGLGGDGHNRVGIFDPFNTEPDPIYGVPVAKEVISVLGPTPDPEFPNTPGAVREWCINSAAVDPFHHWALINSEDGKAYIWDLNTDTLTTAITLTPGIGEAYTPTLIGPDGTGYAINNGELFALATIGVPEPSTIILSIGGVLGLVGGCYAYRRRRKLLADQEVEDLLEE